MRKCPIVVSILVLTVAILGWQTVKVYNSMDQIEFQTISKGYYGRHGSPAYYVIKNEEEWVNVLRYSPPEVDFSKTTIIAVFMGEFASGGFGIEVKEIPNKGQSVAVKVEWTYPSKGCLVTQAFTQPYHIVKMEETDKIITFETIHRASEC